MKKLKTKLKTKLKQLKEKLTGGNSNILDNTNLIKYLTTVSPKIYRQSKLEKIVESILLQKRKIEDPYARLLKKYKVSTKKKIFVEARLRAVHFIMQDSNIPENLMTDQQVSYLMDLLVNMFKKGVRVGKRS